MRGAGSYLGLGDAAALVYNIEEIREATRARSNKTAKQRGSAGPQNKKQSAGPRVAKQRGRIENARITRCQQSSAGLQNEKQSAGPPLELLHNKRNTRC